MTLRSLEGQRCRNALEASIVHEVNQPLTGMIINAGTCLRMLSADPPDVEGARETAQRMLRDGQRAAQIIARLRALFARKPTKMELVDLNDAVREVIGLCGGELRQSGVTLRTDMADEPPYIVGDRIQLQQVMLNLLFNASDAMAGIEPSARQLLVSIECAPADCVRLSVRDTGAGLSTQILGRLFQPFCTTKSDGMGMGLFISRSIIESHHGRLEAAQNEGPGATFSFSIPRARLSAAPSDRQRTGCDHVHRATGAVSSLGLS